MQTCAHCGLENHDENVACIRCGNTLWTKFWRQWTPEAREKLERSPAFQKALASGDIFTAQNIAIGIIPTRILSPLEKMRSLHLEHPLIVNDPKQLLLKL